MCVTRTYRCLKKRYLLKYTLYMLSTTQKSDIITKFATGDKDTGSPQVQVALLTNQIASLADHLKAHKKDNHSRKGLLKMVSKRRRLLKYLNKINETAYEKVVKDLKIGA